MSDMFILDGREPKRCDDQLEWARWFEVADRVVRLTVFQHCRVSTVFLALNHSFSDGPPTLFETMIFGGGADGYQERCGTWAEAEEMHAVALAIAASASPHEQVNDDEL